MGSHSVWPYNHTGTFPPNSNETDPGAGTELPAQAGPAGCPRRKQGGGLRRAARGGGGGPGDPLGHVELGSPVAGCSCDLLSKLGHP